MNGKIKLPLVGNKYFTVVGGPYVECPDGFTGVKLAAEINRPCEIDIPTRDYSTPHPDVLNAGLKAAIDCMLLGRPLYVGCFGGFGRTGLFLAILAKAFNVENPVAFVRRTYTSRAVETNEQKKFVDDFEISWQIKLKLKAARFLYWFWLKNNLTQMPNSLTYTQKNVR